MTLAFVALFALASDEPPAFEGVGPRPLAEGIWLCTLAMSCALRLVHPPPWRRVCARELTQLSRKVLPNSVHWRKLHEEQQQSNEDNTM
eukprot:CAMPEP_0173118588 /NCGR_PEP_ID=MMETSP1102-20130122/51154_1 /TAXON_ID=49646 /ORGANISM="Geminigera sp., Strain Caron Lab Isolate" /LENGTH=88 /DNA_ID=CAMNT_0014023781 /DNA_START=415 /DNA_END=681 /DNA_ORIENTATION=-